MPLLDVMAEAMRLYSRRDVLRLVLEPTVARARGDAERAINMCASLDLLVTEFVASSVTAYVGHSLARHANQAEE